MGYGRESHAHHSPPASTDHGGECKIQAARRAGVTGEEADKILADFAREAAAEQDWRDSALATTLAENARALDAQRIGCGSPAAASSRSTRPL
jgi:hypothetical protein